MSRRYALIAVCLLTLASGCVERRFVIITDPPGAAVWVNNKYVGPSPVTVPFGYYGNYQIQAEAPGYQTIKVVECISPPWYEYFPLEFFSENLLPFWLRDIRELNYKLERTQILSPDQTLQRAGHLRQEGAGVGVPPGQPGIPEGAVPQPVPQGPPPAPPPGPGAPRLLPPQPAS
jgi:hypothetical protein